MSKAMRKRMKPPAIWKAGRPMPRYWRVQRPTNMNRARMRKA
jgi:hypothetical protein